MARNSMLERASWIYLCVNASVRKNVTRVTHRETMSDWILGSEYSGMQCCSHPLVFPLFIMIVVTTDTHSTPETQYVHLHLF